MFGELSKALHKEWYSNEDNLDIKFMINDTTYTYRVFSIYKIKAEDYYINTEVSDIDFNEFVETLKNRSEVKLKTSIKAAKKIITLSTCYDNEDTRLVVHGVLI
jgi:hypothetical protein